MRLQGMSDEERLDFEQTTGIKTEAIDRLVSTSVQQTEEMLTRAIREVQEVIGPHGAISRVQAGGVRIERGTGIGVFADGIKKTTIDVDGNLFVGSDIESPSTTTLSVFVNDQSYQGEDFGAGDLLIGNNASGAANMLYDASEGRLNFRGGSTVEVYIDTDGTIVAGGGNVVIDSAGVTIENSATSFFRFKDASGNPANIVIAADPNNDLEIVNLARSPSGLISFFIKDTAGTTRRPLQILEDTSNANVLMTKLDVPPSGARLIMLPVGGSTPEVQIWAGKDGTETVFNDGSFDIDLRIEGATNPHVFVVDAGLDRVEFKNSSAVAVHIISATGTVYFNENNGDVDFKVEGDTDGNLFWVDAGLDAIGMGGAADAGYKLNVTGGLQTDDLAVTSAFVWDGWQKRSETWTRTGNHTFTVAGDVTARFRKGTKVRYKDGGSYEYGVITTSSYSAPNTTVTLITNTDYAMAAATITDTYLSYIENPEGFPNEFAFDLSTGLVTIGNGTQEGYWKTVANKIFIHGGVLYGSTTTFGSSDLTLPVAILSSYDISAAQSPLGIATYLDAGTASYLGNIRRQTSTTARFQAVGAGGTWGTTSAITSTVPITWGNTDELSFFIEYLF